jgi:hypothetical protein
VTTDTCQGTTIQTQRGVVEVTDFVRHRVVILPAPLSYFASRNRTGG